MTQPDDFLGRVHGGRISPRDRLRIERLWSRFPDRAARRAALSSLLASGKDDWEQIARIFDECFPDPAEVRAQQRARRHGKVRQVWRNVCLPLLLLPALLLVADTPRLPPSLVKPSVMVDKSPPPLLPPPPKVRPTWRLSIKTPASAVPLPVSDSPRLPLLLSLPFLLLGLRFLRLPWAVRHLRPREAAVRDAERLREREALAEQHARRLMRGGPRWDIYRVPVYPRFPRSTVEDCAVYLGRVFRKERGTELDVPATLAEIVRHGGPPRPVFLPGKRAREILVLCDREQGDHPDHGGFLRLLDAWERLGVRLLRYSFQKHPVVLDDPRGGRSVPLRDLSRLHPEAALLFFSRRRHLFAGEQGFVRDLAPFPLKVWLDPDPLRPLREKKEVIRVLIAAGLPRFPYTPRGLLSLARHLSVDGIGVRPAPFPRLPRGPRVDASLRLWAAAAALVPDPSWDQLEDFRRNLEEIGAGCPEPGQVHQLVRRLTDEAGEDVEGEGSKLLLPEDLEEKLVNDVRRDHPEFAGKVDDLVLKHLTEPPCKKEEDPYLYYRWELKRAAHLAPRHRRWTDLEQVLDGPLCADGRRLVRLELGRDWLPEAERDRLAVRIGDRVALLWRDLLFGFRRLWWAAAALAVVPCTVFLALRGQVQVTASIPATYKIEEVRGSECERCKPKMVQVPAGRFQMGSDDGDAFEFEKPVHKVEISQPFLLGETEVTQAQYREVTRETPSYFKGDDLPVEYVSWLDAITYCNKLSDREGLGPCYQVSGEKVDWIAGCLGYRLPTEAEWEYAAKALQRTKYAGGSDPSEVAWYEGNADGRTHPVKKLAANAWHLYDMSGNVYEWVWDWWSDKYAAGLAHDPKGPDNGSYRVYRGGCFEYSPRYLRVSYRYGDYTGDIGGVRYKYLGFRVARSLP